MVKKDKYSYKRSSGLLLNNNSQINGTNNKKHKMKHSNVSVTNKIKQNQTNKSNTTINITDELPTNYNNALQWLLGNTITVEQFFNDYWEQKPLYIKNNNNNNNRFQQLYTKQVFDQWLKQNQHELQYGVNLNVFVYDKHSGRKVGLNEKLVDDNDDNSDQQSVSSSSNDKDNNDSNSVSETDDDDDDEDGTDSLVYANVSYDYVQQMYTEQQASIQHIQPQQYNNSKLVQLISLLETQFGSLVGCNSYITPGNKSQGLAPHYDDIEAFILQCQGNKSWSLWLPKQELQQQQLPYIHSGDLDVNVLGKPDMNITLEPGDVLYMPRGTIHKATTLDNDDSVHLTLSTYQQQTWFNYISLALNNALEHARQQCTEFRQGLPIAYNQYMGTGNQLALDIAETTQIGNEKLLQQNIIKQEQFSNKFDSLLNKLNEYIDLHSTADDMIDDYMTHKLPPYTINNQNNNNNNNNDNDNTVHIQPTTDKHEIKFIDINAIRITVGNIGNDDNDDEQSDSDEDEQQYVYLQYSTQNSVKNHMSSNDIQSTLNRIKLTIDVAPALITLYNTKNKYISISDLPIPDDSSMNNIQLAMALWSINTIQVKEPINE